MTGDHSPAGDRPGGSVVLIREARPGDEADLHRLIRALAEYEREPDAVVATPADLTRVMFGDHPSVYGHVVEEDGRIDPASLDQLLHPTIDPRFERVVIGSGSTPPLRSTMGMRSATRRRSTTVPSRSVSS